MTSLVSWEAVPESPMELVRSEPTEQNLAYLLDVAGQAIESSTDMVELMAVHMWSQKASVFASMKGLDREAAKALKICRRIEVQYVQEYPKQKGGRGNKLNTNTEVYGVTQSLRNNLLRAYPDPDKALEYINACPEESELVSRYAIQKHFREEKRREVELARQDLRSNPIPSPTGTYSTFVIDPPWPMKKIEREVAPNQAAIDYPTMSIAEIKEIDVPGMVDNTRDGALLFMWTTQKYLLPAIDIIQTWDFRYRYLMVWHKTGGFQPYNCPQFNGEFVAVGAKGNPQFTDTSDFPAVFEGKRRGHSVKPVEFYDMIRRATEGMGSRIDMFAREAHEGFVGWGNEYGSK